MLKYREVVGLPVISRNGKHVADVKDILFSPDGELTGLILQSKGLRQELKSIAVDKVHDIGKDAVVVENDACDSAEPVDKNRIKNRFINERVYSSEGALLGFVQDIVFDLNSRRIEQMILSDGPIQDILTGRRILPAFGKMEMGEDCIFATREAVEEMSHNGKGLKKFINNS